MLQPSTELPLIHPNILWWLRGYQDERKNNMIQTYARSSRFHFAVRIRSIKVVVVICSWIYHFLSFSFYNCSLFFNWKRKIFLFLLLANNTVLVEFGLIVNCCLSLCVFWYIFFFRYLIKLVKESKSWKHKTGRCTRKSKKNR